MKPDAHAALTDMLEDGPVDGLIAYQTQHLGQQTLHGRIEHVTPHNPWQPTRHVRLTDKHGVSTIIAICNVDTVAAVLVNQSGHTPSAAPSQPAQASATVTLLPAQVEQVKTDAANEARAEVFAEVNRILDSYNESSVRRVAQCAPEDAWRLYRDLHVLTGRINMDHP